MTLVWLAIAITMVIMVVVEIVVNTEKIDRSKIKTVEEIYEDKWY